MRFLKTAEYAHKNNFPVFDELLKKLETIDKNANTGYDESNNIDVSDMIEEQNKLRIHLNTKLEEYGIKLCQESELKISSAILVAVAHSSYTNRSAKKW